VFESAVDGLGGAVAGAGTLEVGQHVGGPLLQGASEGDELGERVGTPWLSVSISFLISNV
jgi:hypothetical protein